MFKRRLYTNTGLRVQLDAGLDYFTGKSPLIVAHSLTSIPAIEAVLTGYYEGRKLPEGTKLVIVSPVRDAKHCLINRSGINNDQERRFGELGRYSPKWLTLFEMLQDAPEWLPPSPLYPLQAQELHDGKNETIDNKLWAADPWVHLRSGKEFLQYDTLGRIKKHFDENVKFIAIEPLVVITTEDKICGPEDQEEIASLIADEDNIFRLDSGHRFGTGSYEQVRSLVDRIENYRQETLRKVA